MARRVKGVAVIEGTQTGDGRVISAGAITWAPLPLPLGWLQQEQHGDLLGGAVQIGTLDTLTRVGSNIEFTGTIDDEQPDGAEMVRRLEAGTAPLGERWGVSIDPDNWNMELLLAPNAEDDETVMASVAGRGVLPPHVTAAAGDPDPAPGTMELLFSDNVDDVIARYTALRVRGLTACAIAAFDGAWMELDGAGDATTEVAPVTPAAAAVVAAATLIVSRPPAEWFATPEPQPGDTGMRDVYGMDVSELLVPQPDGGLGVPWTMLDDGRCFGHAARWGQCFAGETEYLTDSGVRTLKETVGTTQRVLVSRSGLGLALRAQREFGGEWVDAEIRSFGVQPLMKVILRRFGQTKVVFATADHRWLVTPRNKGNFRHTERAAVLTRDLRPDDRLSPLFPKKRATIGKGITPSQFGIAHGMTFGDGTRHRDGCRVDLNGEKDAALAPYFSMSTQWQQTNQTGTKKLRVANLPAFFKDRPSLGESASYLYGWLAGYFAADGTVAPIGTPIIFSATREHLEFYRDACSRLGIGTSEIKTFMRRGAGPYVGPGPVNNNRMSVLHRMTLIASTLTEAFFLIPEHQRRFQARPNVADPYTAWHVESVEETDRCEEVYCAVVPEHENFTLLDNINVMNCHVGYPGACVTAPESLASYAHFHHGEVICDDGRHLATGVLTMGCDHAAAELRAPEARDHYAHSGMGFADVRASNGTLGVWLSGVARPDVTDEQMRILRASSLSADWRRIGAGLEFIAALAVNVPGFPIAREALSAAGLVNMPAAALTASAWTDDGVQQSLVAAGVVHRCPECQQRLLAARGGGAAPGETELRDLLMDMAGQLGAIEVRTRHLVPAASAAALARIRRG